MGRSRALEAVLAGDTVDASTAAAYGWVNRAIPAAQLDDYVNRVVRNVAALADGVIGAAKRALPVTEFAAGLVVENDAWASLVGLPGTQRLMADALTAGAQTPEGEAELEDLLRGLRL